METLQSRLVDLVDGTPPGALARIQADLAGGALTLNPAPDIPGYLLGPLVRAWESVGKDLMPPQALAVALGAVRQARARMLENAPKLDLVWTGPHSPSNLPARSTATVLREMIEGARHRILVVGYNLTRGNALSAGVVEALALAMTNRCRVIMALHDDGTNARSLAELWPRETELPHMLRWVGQPGNPTASLHAKLVVVDARDLLVTSANLTYNGLEQNIEVGVRIEGKFAFEVDRHFATLERDGILVPYQGALR